MIPDKAKLKIIAKLRKLPDSQIDALGKLLAQERKYMITHKDTIIKQTKLLLDTLALATK